MPVRSPRSDSPLSQAEDEHGQSRIYLGVHWPVDEDEGIALGRKVGACLFPRGPAQPGT